MKLKFIPKKHLPLIHFELRMLFLHYDRERSLFNKQLEISNDKRSILKIKKKLENLEKLQIELIQQYIEEISLDLPYEMIAYFDDEYICYENGPIIIGES